METPPHTAAAHTYSEEEEEEEAPVCSLLIGTLTQNDAQIQTIEQSI